MKVLIMGLPGSGKTWLAERLQAELDCAWYNADTVRKMANDWDFSDEGRNRQSNRMRTIADYEKNQGRVVICDFVCPTKETREAFDADLTIWLDTIQEGRFEDTNKIFERPIQPEFTITSYMSDEEISEFAADIKERINV